MDLLNGKIKSLYFRYLSAAFGSALISCIYGVVDMAMVGQYQGPEGSAALAVVSPLWNVIYSLGLLMGIGGSVIFSVKRGGQGKNLSLIHISDALLAIGWYETGEVFRSACCFNRGYGKVFYFQPGHETLHSFHNEYVQLIIRNAAHFTARDRALDRELHSFHAIPALEPKREEN